ncbi:hypothetical protein C0992_008460 [Termitomyces sp. T32_za158]|nr:hypothetical protein C0992_008460 [Termitomyces sp. T32_za158]
MSSSPLASLPPSLNLPPHLSAHKYFFVCTLTVAAWDTLVLSPRSWRLLKTPGWPIFKVVFHFLRVFMPVEFVIVAVAFFDTKWSQSQCQNFYLFEPICTAILLVATSIVHVVRIHAIYDKNRTILYGMGALFALQIVVTAVCCGFYRSVPLLEGQGCIAGPKHNWVGIYWLAPTLLYTVSFALALARSLKSLQAKPLSPWKLMLRDGLNLYGVSPHPSITPSHPTDEIISGHLPRQPNKRDLLVTTPPHLQPKSSTKHTHTHTHSMAAVLTTSMTLRIILSVRGSLAHGGTFALSASHAGSSRTAHVISTRTGGVPTNVSTHNAGHTYTLDDMRAKPEAEWASDKASENESKPVVLGGHDAEPLSQSVSAPVSVKVTVDRQVGYDDAFLGGRK